MSDTKGALHTLRITDLNNLGCGVGRLPSEDGTPDAGRVVFVRGAVTGDLVETQLIKVTSSFAVGRLIRVITPSPERAPEDLCAAPEACGGCVYRHLTYEAELASKHRRVEAAFRQAGLSGTTILPVLSTGQITGYRNKGMYPVRNGKGGMEAGFFAARSHTLIPCTACAQQPPLFARIVRAVCDFCDTHGIVAYDEITGRGVLRHIYLRTSTPEDGRPAKIMLCLVIRTPSLPGGDATARALVESLTAAFPQIVSILLNIHPTATNVVLGDTYIPLYGDPALEDTLCDRRFRISAGAFYQVNHDAAQLLYRLAAARAGLTGREHLWDLYCGAGTIGLSMVGTIRTPDGDVAGAADVTGVEIVKEAVERATENAVLNASLGLIPENVARFFCADAGDPASLFAAADRGDVPSPDVVIIDPPRKGTTPELIREIARRDIRRVVYISCDPETLARDCAVFRACGYLPGDVQPVDLFPRTGHVECVVALLR